MTIQAASLAALGPGLGVRSGDPFDVRAFARRRIDHLREKLASGELQPTKLQHRLFAMFGEVSFGLVGDDGDVDLEVLETIITAQQAAKLRARLVDWFGDEASAVIDKDGEVDQGKLEGLIEGRALGTLRGRLVARYGDWACDLFEKDESLAIDSLRALVQSNSWQTSSALHED